MRKPGTFSFIHTGTSSVAIEKYLNVNAMTAVSHPGFCKTYMTQVYPKVVKLDLSKQQRSDLELYKTQAEKIMQDHDAIVSLFDQTQ